MRIDLSGLWGIDPRERVGGVIKYFELPVVEATRWGLKEYLLFSLEAFYTTILPFFAGVELVATGQTYWILLMLIPLVLRFRYLRQGDKRPKRIYIN